VKKKPSGGDKLAGILTPEEMLVYRKAASKVAARTAEGKSSEWKIERAKKGAAARWGKKSAAENKRGNQE
jgi:hypothetical protein